MNILRAHRYFVYAVTSLRYLLICIKHCNTEKGHDSYLLIYNRFKLLQSTQPITTSSLLLSTTHDASMNLLLVYSLLRWKTLQDVWMVTHLQPLQPFILMVSFLELVHSELLL